ncbi:ATP-binding protein [Blastococcus sp. TML/M2B]|uniref:ATP-binding protein n=1 Tax=unclassified Blastococcus TaxID=2619396 RepID=UPI00190AB937|nr:MULTISPECIES: ATP-binding protein [unclassified Blastococcus]MBN1093306.1 ATP-binding protein [Blastococcus sp. TML/M2B]MBN1096581.1 ATP-binding protein [Blastococcus sp. TML/C7B]
MDISFSVRLPRDARSLPLMRGLLRQALEHLDVARSTIEEVVLALTEACANVVQHAGEHEEYQVDVAITDDTCRVSVLDDGQGFDFEQATAAEGSPLDTGRGLVLMQALVDKLEFVRSDDGRHRVELIKRLRTEPTLRLLQP